jgi:tetraacyldisaccharide 4'-kinase
MLNQEDYRRLISGQNSGAAAAVLRFFLGLVAAGYSATVRLRNFLYSTGLLKTYRANVPVISVGNITAGGTGKTPLVVWLCKFLQQKQIRCAILTRGYKTYPQKRAASGERRATRTDEPAILAKSCPQAKVIVNPHRVAAAVEAVDKFGAKVSIMDDGFQHRRLFRDLDIVTIDATRPFGYSKILPAGLLREPLSALTRADAVVITKSDQTNEKELARLEKKLREVNPGMIIAKSIHKPVCARSPDGKETSVKELKDKKIFAFCGIGNPAAFLETIRGFGANLVGSKIYDDHYRYTDNDIEDIHKQAKILKADLILTTQKDWYSTQYTIRRGSHFAKNAKWGPSTQYELPFGYLAIELIFTAGEDKITQLIERTLAGKIVSGE